ncbi:homeodomain transcription factor ste12 [Ceratobasidium sp. 394]|nr:homeodomain transcription factor ste12 [Ceratobasidium sp. 394]
MSRNQVRLDLTEDTSTIINNKKPRITGPGAPLHFFAAEPSAPAPPQAAPHRISSAQRQSTTAAGSASTQTNVTPIPRSLTVHEQDMIEQLNKFKYFLATASSKWSSPHSSSSDALVQYQQTTSHPAMNRFLLPSGEFVSCVLWDGLYHISRTDIIRSLVFRFDAFARPVRDMKKFEEGVFSDLRNLKPGSDARLEEPNSPFLNLLFKYQCIRTQKKQKVFYWYSVPHDRLFLDALERDLKREKMGLEPTTVVVGEPARSFTYDPKRTLYEQFVSSREGENSEELDQTTHDARHAVASTGYAMHNAAPSLVDSWSNVDLDSTWDMPRSQNPLGYAWDQRSTSLVYATGTLDISHAPYHRAAADSLRGSVGGHKQPFEFTGLFPDSSGDVIRRPRCPTPSQSRAREMKRAKASRPDDADFAGATSRYHPYRNGSELYSASSRLVEYPPLVDPRATSGLVNATAGITSKPHVGKDQFPAVTARIYHASEPEEHGYEVNGVMNEAPQSIDLGAGNLQFVRDIPGNTIHAPSRAVSPGPSLVPSTIGRATTLSDVISLLVKHGCQNVTEILDPSSHSDYPISSGGFGDVYKGRLRDGSSIAIKCMRIIVDPDSSEDQKHLKCAAREIHTWSKLRHRYISKLLGLALFRGQIAMVSPWAERGSLPIYLRKKPELNRPLLCMRIAEGLAFLHSSGVVHGDLKGANVLVSDSDEPLLVDFGNAVLYERTLQFTLTTARNNLSPRWTAPELLKEGPYSVEADVYALGMTILEVIIGEVPYASLKDTQVIVAVLFNQRHPKRQEEHIPTTIQGNLLWSTLSECWAFDPKSRPTAAQVQDMMATITPGGLIPRGENTAQEDPSGLPPR